LASRGARAIMTCRNEDKAKQMLVKDWRLLKISPRQELGPSLTLVIRIKVSNPSNRKMLV
jgi:hypothetical protein